MVLNMLEASYNILFDAQNAVEIDKHRLNEKLVRYIEDIIIKEAEQKKKNNQNENLEVDEGSLNEDISFKTIKMKTIKQSFELLSYFNKHKLVLANYHVNDWNANIYDVLDELIKHEKSKKSNKNYSDLDLKLIELVLNFNKKEFSCNDVNQKTSLGNAADVKRVFYLLESQGLGRVNSEKKVEFK